jgi:oligopeptide/dipeptide ABC transporter ATP-binding protein
MTVRDIIGEGIRIHKVFKGRSHIEGRIMEMLDLVGLSDDILTRYPHEFSGGQRQRISIARALAVQPSFVVCDEVVSALDVSIQAQIVKLLMHLQDSLGLTYVFIGHDLAVVRHISDTIAVMYLGKFMEMTDSEELYTRPLHPYTKALISAAPIPNPRIDRSRERILLSGEIPSSINPPEGCNFCTRCPLADRRCTEEEPKIREVASGHFVACHKV